MSRVRILDLDIDLLTMEDLTGLVAAAVQHGRQILISNHNLHSAYLFHNHPEIAKLYRAMDYVHVDGMPLILAGRLLGVPCHSAHRVAYLDWFPRLFAQAAKNKWRIYYVGSGPGVGEKAANVFRKRDPELQIQTADGFFDAQGSSSSASVITAVNRFNPDILIVGMGMPRQEEWIIQNRSRISARAILASCGATMEFFAGMLPTPPRWAGRLGLEWFFRLIARPQRMWKRYLVEPWFITPLLIDEYLDRKMLIAHGAPAASGKLARKAAAS